MAAIIRLKRKACDEPADGLVIALKKPKCELSDAKVYFKFATTLNSEKDSVRDHIQAALSKENKLKGTNPKDSAINENKITKVRKKLQAEHKSANEKKKLDFLNNKRLILTEEFKDFEDDSFNKDTEVRRLFHLYDISEENEDVKKQNDELKSTITCNDEPLIREKHDEYVFDVYIADGHIDQTFVHEAVSVRPCTMTSEDLYCESEESEECYEDEDDSNDENNWRNDYPEEEDSNSETGHSHSETESYEGVDFLEEYNDVLSRDFEKCYLDVDEIVNYDASDDDDDEDEDRGQVFNESSVLREYYYD